MRTLTLRKEALASLTTDELTSVGAAGTTDLLTQACVTQTCTGIMCLLSNGGPLCLEG